MLTHTDTQVPKESDFEAIIEFPTQEAANLFNELFAENLKIYVTPKEEIKTPVTSSNNSEMAYYPFNFKDSKGPAEAQTAPAADYDFTDLAEEDSRTYLFPGDEEVTIEGATKLCVQLSGNHRLETADGRKYVVSAGWLAIEIESGSN